MIDMFWKAAVLGIVQGITEFLPISSTGHLILVDQFLHMAEGSFSKMFNVVIQFGSILAVVIYFHKKLIPVAMFSDKKVCRDTLEIWFKTLAGVFPILLIGFLLASKIEMLQESPLVVAAALLIGGVVLIKVEAWCRKEHPIETFHELSYTRAVLIGLIQCLAMIPGTSRSASTIIGGLALGASSALGGRYGRDSGKRWSIVSFQIGNKCDLANQRCISTEEAIAYAEKHNMAFIETSAYDRTGIDDAFSTVLKGGWCGFGVTLQRFTS